MGRVFFISEFRHLFSKYFGNFFFFLPSVDDGCERKPGGGEEDRVLRGSLGTRGSGQIRLLQSKESLTS